MKYMIPGKPIPLKRPRFGQGRVYDSQKKLKERDQYYLRMHRPQMIVKQPIELNIVFYFQLPKRFKRREYLHYSRPDLSNLIKYYEDICMGILFDDDCIISRIVAEKRYDVRPRTEFTISLITARDVPDSMLEL